MRVYLLFLGFVMSLEYAYAQVERSTEQNAADTVAFRACFAGVVPLLDIQM